MKAISLLEGQDALIKPASSIVSAAMAAVVGPVQCSPLSPAMPSVEES